jgi:hypothetical protein
VNPQFLAFTIAWQANPQLAPVPNEFAIVTGITADQGD